MKLRIIAIVATLVAMTSVVSAQKRNLVLHYDFKHTVGNTVIDLSANKVNAQLKNGATVSDGVLHLGYADGYLDLTESAGQIVKGLTDYSVVVRYKIDASVEIKGYGYFLWCFSCLSANREKEGPYQAYRINEQRCETSIGGWSQETGIQASKVSKKGKWITVVYRQNGNKGQLYIDGELIGSEETFPVLRDIFTIAPAYCWIGRPPFDGDNYLRGTDVEDFRVYNICISDKEMKRLVK